MTIPDIKLPPRPLKLKRGVLSVPFAYYFSPVILLALAVFMLVAEGPGIIRDYKISQNPVEIADGDLNGSCKTRKAVFTTCNAKLAYDYEGKHYKSDVEVMFIDMHSGDYEAGLVISGSDPQLATISLGLDMLWNRIITLVILSVLLGIGGVALLLALVRYFRAKSKLDEAQPLILLPVALTSVTKKTRRRFHHVCGHHPREQDETTILFPSGQGRGSLHYRTVREARYRSRRLAKEQPAARPSGRPFGTNRVDRSGEGAGAVGYYSRYFCDGCVTDAKNPAAKIRGRFRPAGHQGVRNHHLADDRSGRRLLALVCHRRAVPIHVTGYGHQQHDACTN